MREAKRTEGRPRARENVLSRWIDAKGLTREKFAKRLGIQRTYLDMICRGYRRAGFDLSLTIQKRTKGEITVEMLAKLARPTAVAKRAKKRV